MHEYCVVSCMYGDACIYTNLNVCGLFLGETEKVENPWANRFVPHYYTEHKINSQKK